MQPRSTSHLDDLLTRNTVLRPKQQAQLLGVSTVTLWRRRDELPPTVKIGGRDGGRTLGDLLDMIERQKRGGPR